MGTTAASLHIALPNGAGPDQSGPLLKAYARLGWSPPKRGEAATRSVRLARNEKPFVSIYDSACEDLDDGALKQLAAMLSKALKTAAIIATVYDSDVFEFLLYHRGKQVDAVTDSPDGLDAGVKSVRGKRQATKWLEALVSPGRDPRRRAGRDLRRRRHRGIRRARESDRADRNALFRATAGSLVRARRSASPGGDRKGRRARTRRGRCRTAGPGVASHGGEKGG